MILMVEFKRKLYKRGSSFETTVPMPILFDKDISKKHTVKFLFDSERKRWYLEIEEEEDEK
jgi:hypothetical protein